MQALSSKLILSLLLILIGISSFHFVKGNDQVCHNDDACIHLTGSVCSSDGFCRCKVGQMLVNDKECVPWQCKGHADCNLGDGSYFNLLVPNVISCNSATRLCECDQQNSKVPVLTCINFVVYFVSSFQLSSDGTGCTGGGLSTLHIVLIVIAVVVAVLCISGTLFFVFCCCGCGCGCLVCKKMCCL